MARLGLQQVEEVTVGLRLLVVWKGAALDLARFVEMAGDLVLLFSPPPCPSASQTQLPTTASLQLHFRGKGGGGMESALTSSNAMRF